MARVVSDFVSPLKWRETFVLGALLVVRVPRGHLCLVLAISSRIALAGNGKPYARTSALTDENPPVLVPIESIPFLSHPLSLPPP